MNQQPAIGEADLRPALHAEAIDALAASPVPAFLDAVDAIRKALLGVDPRALRRSVGWFGRLLGRDIALQAEAEAIAARLGVHVIAARQRLDEVKAHRLHLATLRDGLLQAAARLMTAADRPIGGDASAQQRIQHLLSTAHAYRITASHLELTGLELDRLCERVGLLIPRAQLLLDQQRALRDGRERAAAPASTVAALDTLQQLVRDALPASPTPTSPAPPVATTRSTP